ncbi:MAG TPA: DUF6800 family protein [Verrucomicrobiae bacterium]|nr:DUF6800 family protein [Verrucomicrobiae bacterium]
MMGKIRKTKRKLKIRQKKERREKYQKLKAKYLAAGDPEERKKILEKLAAIAPFVGVEKWLEKTRRA